MSMTFQVSPEVYALALRDAADSWELADVDGTFAVTQGLATQGITFAIEERDGQARLVRNPALGMEYDLGARVSPSGPFGGINLRIGDAFTFTLALRVDG